MTVLGYPDQSGRDPRRGQRDLRRSITDVGAGPPASRKIKRLIELMELCDGAAVRPDGTIAGLLGSEVASHLGGLKHE